MTGFILKLRKGRWYRLTVFHEFIYLVI